MTRFKVSVRFVMVASVALAVSAATAEARDIKVQRKAIPVATETATPAAPAEIAASAPVAWTAAPVKTAAPAEAAAAPAVPPCARKVKVIYAGYGEANRAASCTMASNEPAS